MNRTIRRFPSGTVALPSSKSAAHRAVICAGLSGGESFIRRVDLSDDVTATVNCVAALGADVAVTGDVCRVHGVSAGSVGVITRGGLRFDCGESGTTLRLMIPVAAAVAESAIFTGRGRLTQRPLTPYFDALQSLDFSVAGDVISVTGKLVPGEFRLPGDVSSQFVSGLLTALPLLDGDSEIVLSSPLQSASYVDMTVEMLRSFGVFVSCAGDRFIVRGNQRFSAADIALEADFSQAAFFLVAGALGRTSVVSGLSENSTQGDRRILDILSASGVAILRSESGIAAMCADIIKPQEINAGDIPDLVPPVAAMLAFADGTSRITNVSRLRYKESDRLESVTGALRTLGADISHDGETITIRGQREIAGGTADSCGDHRIAMMCAAAAVRCREPVTVLGAECVAKSYPAFWNDFEKEAQS